ncbi:hypothetical protein BX600DRAFT_438816 [Xylariales sp. PMI_506]|nr:hypothetical protein BX600DRAFT_438816 [Xylariales sp. PMI_506]
MMDSPAFAVGPRSDDKQIFYYVSPWAVTNAGLWSLFAGATVFLALRIWCKITRRFGLWYDDYVLIFSWAVLLANNALIIYEFATGYILQNSKQKWDDRMHILINISSCGTVIGQSLTKTAFGVTLLRLTNRWQQYLIWFCIITMNIWMFFRCLFQWAKVCNDDSYQQWYRLNFCIDTTFRDDFKTGGNVYNVLMDFIFATFPWLITRKLDMRRAEKIGLCVAMSLGLVVAIETTVRISWKDDGNTRDPYYIWRNGVSQVWYSSEVAGTIMVQCIPILRTMLREIHTSLTQQKLGSSMTEGKTSSRGSRFSFGKRASHGSMGMNKEPKAAVEVIALGEIPEESVESFTFRNYDLGREMPSIYLPGAAADKPSEGHSWRRGDDWPLSGQEGSDIGVAPPSSGKSLDYFDSDVERDAGHQNGLSPPPQRRGW